MSSFAGPEIAKQYNISMFCEHFIWLRLLRGEFASMFHWFVIGLNTPLIDDANTELYVSQCESMWPSSKAHAWHAEGPIFLQSSALPVKDSQVKVDVNDFNPEELLPAWISNTDWTNGLILYDTVGLWFICSCLYGGACVRMNQWVEDSILLFFPIIIPSPPPTPTLALITYSCTPIFEWDLSVSAGGHKT